LALGAGAGIADGLRAAGHRYISAELSRHFEGSRRPGLSVEATVAVYFLGLALGQSFYGPVADRWGRKRPLYAGLLLFILASAGCAMTQSIGALIALRFLQALGGSAQIVVARAVVRDYFDERDSARVLSLLMLVMGVAPILAPLLGGQLVGSSAGARSSGPWPPSPPPAWSPSPSPCGEPAARAAPAQSPATVFRLYGSLLANRQFMAPVLAGALISAGMFAYIAGSPFVFMEIFGVSPAHFGLFFGSNALGLIAASQINARLVRRFAPARILTVVLIVTAAAGLVLLGTATTGIGGFPGLLAPLFLFVASLGFVAPNATALAMGPQGRNAGSASALLGVIQFTSGGIAGGLVSALYDGTPLPMALVIALCGLGACAIHLRLGRRR
jgi:Arabinose efflux permease